MKAQVEVTTANLVLQMLPPSPVKGAFICKRAISRQDRNGGR